MTISDQSLSPRSKAVYGAAGAAILAAGALATVAGATQSHTGASYYTASFGRAGQGLDERSDLKIRGITVGGVDSVALDKQGRAKVRIRVDKGFRIPATTVAAIEPVSVFGPKDIVLDLGTGEGTGPYLRDGAVIAKTRDPQELADVAWPAYKLTSAIDPQELYTVLHTFAQGLDGKGPQLRRTIDNGSKLIDTAYNNRAAIQQLLRDVEGLSATFGDRGDTLVGMTRDFNDLSPVLTEKPDKINQLLDGSSKLADSVSRNMETQGDKTAALLDSTGKTINVVYSERDKIPILLDGLIQFFGTMDAITKMEGPKGTVVASMNAYVPLDICQTLIDVCAPPTGTKGLGR
jgi:phospholipid/cholesterol/gamma-HCH transport system substrate-binding protein